MQARLEVSLLLQVVCSYSREIQMTKTLVAMLDNRNNKAITILCQWSSNMAAMKSVANNLYSKLVPRVSLLPTPWSERGRRETLGTRLPIQNSLLFSFKYQVVSIDQLDFIFIKTRSKARSLNRQLLIGLFSTVTILSRSASVSSSRTNVERVWISALRRIKRTECHILHSWAVYRVEFEGLFRQIPPREVANLSW